MKNNIISVLLFILIPIIINGQTQEATTSDGKKVILNADGTWKYAEIDRIASEAERKRIEAEQKRQADLMSRTRDALASSKNVGTTSTGEGTAGGAGNQHVPTGSVDSKVRGDGSGLGDKGISYNLEGRGFQSLPSPRYEYQVEGRVVVEVSVDREGRVTQATPGFKGSTTLDENLLKVAREAAMQARFDSKPDAPLIHKGTITYSFILKN